MLRNYETEPGKIFISHLELRQKLSYGIKDKLPLGLCGDPLCSFTQVPCYRVVILLHYIRWKETTESFLNRMFIGPFLLFLPLAIFSSTVYTVF